MVVNVLRDSLVLRDGQPWREVRVRSAGSRATSTRRATVAASSSGRRRALRVKGPVRPVV